MHNSTNTWLLPWHLASNPVTKLFSFPLTSTIPNPLFSLVPLQTTNPAAVRVPVSVPVPVPVPTSTSAGVLYCDNSAASVNPHQLALSALPNTLLSSPSLILGQTIYKVQRDKSSLDKINKSEKRKSDEQENNSELKKAKLETRALKAKRPGFTDDRYNETSYYIENGLRKVYPYYFTFTTFTKGRWVGEKIIDVFDKEFRANPAKEYQRCINAGSLTVNYEKIDIDYRLKHNDLLANVVHRHEVPIKAQPIQIVAIDDDIVVVDKPASIPVHPCGRYRHNTVVFILAKEYNLKNLRTIHRLDRLTSGILLFGRTAKKARELEHQIRNRLVEKEYLCRVEGNFPNGVIESCEPIEILSYKIGVCKVSKGGKECKTTFEKLSYNGHSSVVLCKPRTGRMHQIRVHLQYLGYPVLNDPLYNHDLFGPNKGKNGDMGGRNDQELITDLIRVHNAENWLGTDDNSGDTMLPIFKPSAGAAYESDNKKDFVSENVEHSETSSNICSVSTQTEQNNEYVFDPSKFSVDEHCLECKVKYRDPKPEDLMMYLHAWRYKGPGWEYETELPVWSHESWNEK